MSMPSRAGLANKSSPSLSILTVGLYLTQKLRVIHPHQRGTAMSLLDLGDSGDIEKRVMDICVVGRLIGSD